MPFFGNVRMKLFVTQAMDKVNDRIGCMSEILMTHLFCRNNQSDEVKFAAEDPDNPITHRKH